MRRGKCEPAPTIPHRHDFINKDAASENAPVLSPGEVTASEAWGSVVDTCDWQDMSFNAEPVFNPIPKQFL